MFRSSLMKWVAVAALGVASVPVTAATVKHVKNSKTAIAHKTMAKPTSLKSKSTTLASKSSKPGKLTAKTSRASTLHTTKARPATLNKSTLHKPSTLHKSTITSKSHKTLSTHSTPKSVKPTTLKSGPTKMPAVHSTLSKSKTSPKTTTLSSSSIPSMR